MTVQARESLEELLELLWTAAEDGLTPLDRGQLPASLRCFVPHPIDAEGGDVQASIEEAIGRGLLDVSAGGRIQLSALGRTQAEPVIRRHRLAENLLAGVLELSEGDMESTACQMEHILSAEVTDAVCAFLGHPPACPHDRLIPRGPCCAASRNQVEPLIIPAAQLAVGDAGRVAFIHTRRPQYRRRLSQMGLVPGTIIRIRQRRPTLVLQVGHTDLALDRQAGEEIFVRRSI